MGSDLVMAAVLLVLGLLLMGIEVAILPGVGLVGLMGFGSLSAGCYYLWMAGGPVLGVVGILVSLTLAVGGVLLFLRSRTARSLVLDGAIRGSSSPVEHLAPYVGKVAVAAGALRPSGIVTVDGERFDAVLSDGAFLPAGTRVRIVGQEHGQMCVVALEES